jgi:hypothetical protein
MKKVKNKRNIAKINQFAWLYIDIGHTMWLDVYVKVSNCLF